MIRIIIDWQRFGLFYEEENLLFQSFLIEFARTNLLRKSLKWLVMRSARAVFVKVIAPAVAVGKNVSFAMLLFEVT